MPAIKLRTVWTDDDGMLQVEATISSESHSMTQDFYTYPKQIREFAEKLLRYPDEAIPVVFEYGSANEQYYCHIRISALTIDSVGHSAIKVEFDNHKPKPDTARGEFYVVADPSEINDLGGHLRAWAQDPETGFDHAWREETLDD